MAINSDLEKVSNVLKKEDTKEIFTIVGQKYIVDTAIKKGRFGEAFKVKKIFENKMNNEEEEKMKLFLKNFLIGNEGIEEQYFVIKRSFLETFQTKTRDMMSKEGELQKKNFHPNIVKVRSNRC